MDFIVEHWPLWWGLVAIGLFMVVGAMIWFGRNWPRNERPASAIALMGLMVAAVGALPALLVALRLFIKFVVS
jgi:hypothetical protein